MEGEGGWRWGGRRGREVGGGEVGGGERLEVGVGRRLEEEGGSIEGGEDQ